MTKTIETHCEISFVASYLSNVLDTNTSEVAQLENIAALHRQALIHRR